MLLRGIEVKPEREKSGENEDVYILVPRKEDIALFEDADFRIEPIDCTDISDMLDLEFGIKFWVELPEEVAAAFKKIVSALATEFNFR